MNDVVGCETQPSPGNVALCRAHMTKHNLPGPVIAVVWGGEFFVAGYTTFERVAYFIEDADAQTASSVTSLFETVASLLNVNRTGVDAVTELGALASPDLQAPYDYAIDGASPAKIDVSPTMRAIADDLGWKVPAHTIAGRFHETLVSVALRIALRLRRSRGLSDVILGGSAFRNERLAAELSQALATAAFSVYRG